MQAIHSILILVLLSAVAFLYLDRAKKRATALPPLGQGERIPVLRQGQSNLAITRKGNQVVAVDEEGEEIILKQTRE